LGRGDVEGTEGKQLAAGHGGTGSGGHYYNSDDRVDPRVFGQLAQQMVSASLQGQDGCKDFNSAFNEAIKDLREEEDAENEKGEASWRPFNLSLDEVKEIQPSYGSTRAQDGVRASEIQATVRREITFLRARLRQIIRAAEQSTTVHGMPKGKGLSERQFVDSYLAIRNGEYPTRAFYEEEEALEVSLAAAMVLDESSSMDDKLETATQVMMAITDPLDTVGAKTMAVGFRDGPCGDWQAYMAANKKGGKYHRHGGIVFDIFKRFDERYQSVRWRFANTQATGGTPMADGIWFALKSLQERPEGHRIVFVITDGCPNSEHAPVCNKLVRQAKEAGVHVIGVGVGSGASYVQDRFPDSVYAETIEDLPKMLVKKLNDLLDPRAMNRGKRIHQLG
jgi:nitric oxide reductase activation protein